MIVPDGCCAECWEGSTVATAGGPTCSHARITGASWWPADWAKWPEYQRVEWLERKAAEFTGSWRGAPAGDGRKLKGEKSDG